MTTESKQLEPLLSDHDVAEIIGRSRSTLQKDRLRGGPHVLPFVRVGRLVRYRPSDVRALIERSLRKSTSDPGPAAAQ